MSSNPETVTVDTPDEESAELVLEPSSTDETSSPMSLNAVALDPARVKNIVEAALLAAGQPLSIDRLLNLFMDENQPSRDELRDALVALAAECENRGVELVEVGSGFRYQAKQENAQWISRLWEEKPARYSRALLETLALIAYRQPITRGEIEDIRGVSVSTNIMKTLMEREWVKVVGHRDVPGKPAMYASTKQFLDYFGLKGLSDLPTLAEIRDIDSINAELDLTEPGSEHAEASVETDVENSGEGTVENATETATENAAENNLESDTQTDAATDVDETEVAEAVTEEMLADEAEIGETDVDEQAEQMAIDDATTESTASEEVAGRDDEEQNAVTAADPA